MSARASVVRIWSAVVAALILVSPSSAQNIFFQTGYASIYRVRPVLVLTALYVGGAWWVLSPSDPTGVGVRLFNVLVVYGFWNLISAWQIFREIHPRGSRHGPLGRALRRTRNPLAMGGHASCLVLEAPAVAAALWHPPWLLIFFAIASNRLKETIRLTKARPTVLALGTGKAGTLSLVGRIKWTIYPHPVANLLVDRVGRLPALHWAARDTFRTTSEQEWRDVLTDLMKTCRTILVDQRENSAELDYEVERFQELGLEHKALYVGKGGIRPDRTSRNHCTPADADAYLLMLVEGEVPWPTESSPVDLRAITLPDADTVLRLGLEHNIRYGMVDFFLFATSGLVIILGMLKWLMGAL